MTHTPSTRSAGRRAVPAAFWAAAGFVACSSAVSAPRGSDGGGVTPADAGREGGDGRSDATRSKDAVADVARTREASAPVDAGPAPCCKEGQTYATGGPENNGPPLMCDRCCPGLFDSPATGGLLYVTVTCIPPAAPPDGGASCSGGCNSGSECALPGSEARCSGGDADVGGACLTVPPPCYGLWQMTVCDCNGVSVTFMVGCAGIPPGWVPVPYSHTGPCVDGG